MYPEKCKASSTSHGKAGPGEMLMSSTSGTYRQKGSEFVRRCDLNYECPRTTRRVRTAWLRTSGRGISSPMAQTTDRGIPSFCPSHFSYKSIISIYIPFISLQDSYISCFSQIVYYMFETMNPVSIVSNVEPKH